MAASPLRHHHRETDTPLVPKLQLGHALVPEALLRSHTREARASPTGHAQAGAWARENPTPQFRLLRHERQPENQG